MDRNGDWCVKEPIPKNTLAKLLQIAKYLKVCWLFWASIEVIIQSGNLILAFLLRRQKNCKYNALLC